MNSFNKLLLPAVSALFFTTSFAASVKPVVNTSMHQAKTDAARNLVKKTLRGNASIQKEFNAIANLKGFVVGANGSSVPQDIIYADKQGGYLVIGNVISAKGVNLTRQFTTTYITNVIVPKAFAAAGKSNWFLVGNKNAPHKAYMIFEPNCSACHMAYESMKPMIDSGRLAISFITVAFLKPDSAAKAAAILDAKSPSQALLKDESGFDMRTESGGIAPVKTVSAAAKAKLQANIKFMQMYRFNSTPVVLYKTTGDAYQMTMGFPRDKKQVQEIINAMSSDF